MPTNKQRRDAQRRHLERQLQRRRERDVRRRKTNLIIAIIATLVLVAAVVVSIVAIGGSDKKTPAAKGSDTATASKTPTTTPTSPSATPSTSYPPAAGAAVTFQGVTVKGAADLKGYPVVTAKETTTPTKLAVNDLVVGKGTAAKQGDTATVQYYGVLYKNGTYFDSSWKRGSSTSFPLKAGPGGVITGFATGIGGGDGIAPMKVGGRRIIIVPWADGYGEAGSPPTIPAKADLVFIVDLLKIG